MSLFRHFIPNLEKMVKNNVITEVSNNKFMSSVTYFCLAAVFAPVVILPVIGSSTGNIYKDKMYESLTQE